MHLLLRIILASFKLHYFFLTPNTCDEYFALRTQIRSDASRCQTIANLDARDFYARFPVSVDSLWLCIKVGRGQGDRDIGTRVWGLGTWGRETRDLGTSSMGRGDAGTSKTWTQGTRDVNDYCKSRR